MRCRIKIEIEALNHQWAAADTSLGPLDVLDAHFLQAIERQPAKALTRKTF